MGCYHFVRCVLSSCAQLRVTLVRCLRSGFPTATTDAEWEFEPSSPEPYPFHRTTPAATVTWQKLRNGLAGGVPTRGVLHIWETKSLKMGQSTDICGSTKQVQNGLRSPQLTPRCIRLLQQITEVCFSFGGLKSVIFLVICLCFPATGHLLQPSHAWHGEVIRRLSEAIL